MGSLRDWRNRRASKWVPLWHIYTAQTVAGLFHPEEVQFLTIYFSCPKDIQLLYETLFYKIWKLLFVYNLSSNTLASTDKHIIIYSIGSLSFSCRNNQLVDLKIALQEWAASCVSRATLKLRQLHWIFIQGPFNNQGLTNWHNKWHIWLYYWWK